jgi:hypothetical protein
MLGWRCDKCVPSDKLISHKLHSNIQGEGGERSATKKEEEEERLF